MTAPEPAVPPAWAPIPSGRVRAWHQEGRSPLWQALVHRLHGADAVDHHGLSIADAERLVDVALDEIGRHDGRSTYPAEYGHPRVVFTEPHPESTAAAPWTVTLCWTPTQNGGQVSVLSGRAPLSAVLGQLHAGATPAAIAADYGLTVEEIAVLQRLPDGEPANQDDAGYLTQERP